MKNIFLSASVPLPERDPRYVKTADIIAIRDAVIALGTTVLPFHRIVWGGHPSITPLIYYVMKRLDIPVQDHLTLYQSKLFARFFPEDNNQFNNVIITDAIEDDRDQSLLYMRERMLSENNFSAAVFIGGMDGVEIEYKMFKEKFPDAIVLPIASTGAAARIVYDNLIPVEQKNERLVKDYGYMSLFQKYLLNKI